MSIYFSPKLPKPAKPDGDFGNGRFARNLFEKAVMKQASRLVAMDVGSVTAETLEMLLADDFEAPIMKPQVKNKIGFIT